MITIPLWVRLSFWAVLLTGGGWIAWHVQDWRHRAAEADALEARLKAVIEAHAESEAARIKMAGDLAAAQGKVHTVIKEVIRRVPTLVRDDRVCDFSGELTGVLNRARGYDVPGTGRGATAASPKPKPAP